MISEMERVLLEDILDIDKSDCFIVDEVLERVEIGPKHNSVLEASSDDGFTDDELSKYGISAEDLEAISNIDDDEDEFYDDVLDESAIIHESLLKPSIIYRSEKPSNLTFTIARNFIHSNIVAPNSNDSFAIIDVGLLLWQCTNCSSIDSLRDTLFKKAFSCYDKTAVNNVNKLLFDGFVLKQGKINKNKGLLYNNMEIMQNDWPEHDSYTKYWYKKIVDHIMKNANKYKTDFVIRGYYTSMYYEPHELEKHNVYVDGSTKADDIISYLKKLSFGEALDSFKNPYAQYNKFYNYYEKKGEILKG